MAYKRPKKSAESAEGKASPHKDLLTRVRKRYKIMADADKDNRKEFEADIRFVNVPGAQWDENMKKQRGKRPCYEFNKLRVTCKRVINDMRANRPAAKVRATEDGDKDTAGVYEGLGRNILSRSDFDTIQDYEAEYQVGGGLGAWRVETKYASEDVFDQDICISAIPNPLCLWWDPGAKDLLKRDAADWILEDRMSKESFAARWPDAKPVNFDGEGFDDNDEWEDEESVRVVEYWYKEPYTKEIWQLDDGKVVDSTKDEAKLIEPERIKKRRKVTCDRIKMCIASGSAMLEEPTDWAGRMFPFVVVFGEYVIIAGRVYWFGLPRFAKDAQREYNFSRTAVAETIALAPQAKWWASTKQAEGNIEQWKTAHQENIPVLLYNPDVATGGAPPQRLGGADVPVALVQEVQISSEDIKGVTGIFDPSLGNKSNETSGRAIAARQQQGEIATLNYRDNMGKGVLRTWEILIDLIPEIYDTERELRVLGADGAEDYVRVNEVKQDPATGEMVKIHDLDQGKYDVTVTVGPSWATKRMEAAEVYSNLGQQVPAMWAAAGDLIVKAMDLPYSDEIAERLQAMLPPQVQQMIAQGKEIPPEAQAAMAQAANAMQIVQQQGQLVQAAAQEVEQGKAEADKAKAEVQQAIAELETKKAQFDAYVAKQLAGLAQKEAQSAAKGAEGAVAQDRESLATEVQQAVANIQALAAQFMQQAQATLAEIMAKQQTQVIVPAPPRRPKVVEIRRGKGGSLIPRYDDDDDDGPSGAPLPA